MGHGGLMRFKYVPQLYAVCRDSVLTLSEAPKRSGCAPRNVAYFFCGLPGCIRSCLGVSIYKQSLPFGRRNCMTATFLELPARGCSIDQDAAFALFFCIT